VLATNDLAIKRIADTVGRKMNVVMSFTMYPFLRHDTPGHANMPAISTVGRVGTKKSPISTVRRQKGRVMTKLDVYISEECWVCNETRRIVADITPRFPDLDIELRDVEDKWCPSTVFATPTYVLDGRTIYLGNPTREELTQKLKATLQKSSE
jgi:hypothetical protein